MDTIYINTDKISKIVIKDIRPVIWGGRVKYYIEKKGWWSGYKEGYYTEGEQGQWIGEYTKTDKHFDLEGYLYYKPEIVIYGNSSEDILFRKYFDDYEERDNFLQDNFEEFINNKKIVKICD